MWYISNIMLYLPALYSFFHLFLLLYLCKYPHCVINKSLLPLELFAPSLFIRCMKHYTPFFWLLAHEKHLVSQWRQLTRPEKKIRPQGFSGIASQNHVSKKTRSRGKCWVFPKMAKKIQLPKTYCNVSLGVCLCARTIPRGLPSQVAFNSGPICIYPIR